MLVESELYQWNRNWN